MALLFEVDWNRLGEGLLGLLGVGGMSVEQTQLSGQFSFDFGYGEVVLPFHLAPPP